VHVLVLSLVGIADVVSSCETPVLSIVTIVVHFSVGYLFKQLLCCILYSGVTSLCTPWSIKKVPLLFFSITLANIDGFS